MSVRYKYVILFQQQAAADLRGTYHPIWLDRVCRIHRSELIPFSTFSFPSPRFDPLTLYAFHSYIIRSTVFYCSTKPLNCSQDAAFDFSSGVSRASVRKRLVVVLSCSPWIETYLRGAEVDNF
jgi:hypothetical protein